MAELSLLIGNKNYSSWSLRPWLVLAHGNIPFEEKGIWLYTDEGRAELVRESPSAKVPLLRHADLTVWESLAICEYLAELHPELGLWPDEAGARAQARSVSAEMHAGFTALRGEMPMNCSRNARAIPGSDALTRDLDRLVGALTAALGRSGGPFLFGRFGIADAMYAPVVIRFVGYAVEPGGRVGQWMQTMLGLPSMQRWIEAGRAETHRLPEYEK